MMYLRKAKYVGPIKEWRGQNFLAKRYKETYDSKYTWVYQADLFDHPMGHGWHNIPRHHMRFFTPGVYGVCNQLERRHV